MKRIFAVLITTILGGAALSDASDIPLPPGPILPEWIRQDFTPAKDMLTAFEYRLYETAAINGRCHLAGSILFNRFTTDHFNPEHEDQNWNTSLSIGLLPHWWVLIVDRNYPLVDACYWADKIVLHEQFLADYEVREPVDWDWSAYDRDGGPAALRLTIRDSSIQLQLFYDIHELAFARIAFARIAVQFGDRIFSDTGALPRGFVAYQLLTAKAAGSPIPDDFDALLGEATEGLTEDEIARLTDAAEDWRPVDEAPPDGIDPFAEFEAIGISQPR